MIVVVLQRMPGSHESGSQPTVNADGPWARHDNGNLRRG
jgi:hypothetical protein